MLKQSLLNYQYFLIIIHKNNFIKKRKTIIMWDTKLIIKKWIKKIIYIIISHNYKNIKNNQNKMIYQNMNNLNKKLWK